MRAHARGAVADAVDEFCAEQVDRQLNGKIHGDKNRGLGKTDAELRPKRDEKQRREIVDNSLTHIAHATGAYCDFVVLYQRFHLSNAFPPTETPSLFIA